MVSFVNKIVGGVSSKQGKNITRIREDCVQPFECLDTAANQVERGDGR